MSMHLIENGHPAGDLNSVQGFLLLSTLKVAVTGHGPSVQECDLLGRQHAQQGVEQIAIRKQQGKLLSLTWRDRSSGRWASRLEAGERDSPGGQVRQPDAEGARDVGFHACKVSLPALCSVVGVLEPSLRAVQLVHHLLQRTT